MAFKCIWVPYKRQDFDASKCVILKGRLSQNSTELLFPLSPAKKSKYQSITCHSGTGEAYLCPYKKIVGYIGGGWLTPSPVRFTSRKQI
jgi:hypothetical protein